MRDSCAGAAGCQLRRTPPHTLTTPCGAVEREPAGEAVASGQLVEAEATHHCHRNCRVLFGSVAQLAEVALALQMMGRSKVSSSELAARRRRRAKELRLRHCIPGHPSPCSLTQHHALSVSDSMPQA